MKNSGSLNEQRLEPSGQVIHKSVPWLIAGVIFIAVNMRAPLTSVGPLVELIRDHLHLSNTMAGMITTLPLLSFALFSPFAPKLAERLGMEMTLFMAVILLAIGIFMRTIPVFPAFFLYMGTAILGLGIAVCNVLLPSLVKSSFPNQIGLMTGTYSISMNIFGAIASGISIPIAIGFGWGWQGALGVWGILSILGVLFWIPQVRHRSHVLPTVQQKAPKKQNMWRSPLAWQVTLYMGLQSTLFYCMITWLPEVLTTQGISVSQAGWFLSFMQLSVLPITFITPIIAGRMKNQRLIVTITSACIVIGLSGLIYGSIRWLIIWIIILGIGLGLAFGLAMILFNLRTKTAQEAAELSGMAQSFGYLLAAIGPILLGYTYDLTKNWTVALVLLMSIAIILFLVGLGAGRNKFVGTDE